MNTRCAACLPVVLLALGAAAAPLPPPRTPLSAATRDRLDRAVSGMEETLLGRRLVAETVEVPRRESDDDASAAGVRFVPGSPAALVFGPRRLKALADGELELVLARELARAAADLPVPMPEAEMAAYQTEIEYALDRGVTDQGFAQRLRGAFDVIARRDAQLQAGHRRIKSLAPKAESLSSALLPTPEGEFERIAYYILLFGRDKEEFYWAVEQSVPQEPGLVHLTELEDFVERYGPDFSSAQVDPNGYYARMGGRRYPPVLLEAARKLAASGGLVRIREALGPFETVGAAALKVKVNAWLRMALFNEELNPPTP
jgi:hypothetical protein